MPANTRIKDLRVNNASSLGPTPLAPLADTNARNWSRGARCEPVGAVPIDQSPVGALAASARDQRGAVVTNISSDAAINPYSGWVMYQGSRAINCTTRSSS